jgi:hypothetical protein
MHAPISFSAAPLRECCLCVRETVLKMPEIISEKVNDFFMPMKKGERQQQLIIYLSNSPCNSLGKKNDDFNFLFNKTERVSVAFTARNKRKRAKVTAISGRAQMMARVEHDKN